MPGSERARICLRPRTGKTGQKSYAMTSRGGIEMRSSKQRTLWLAGTVAAGAILPVQSALAQSAPQVEAPVAAGAEPVGGPTENALAQGDAATDIVVTGSRTVTNGYSSPTPVTVVTATQLANVQPQSLSQGLNQSPQFRNSASPQSNGSGTSVGSSLGASYLNLRGLGTQRTLVLLDGHRLTPTSFLGPTDIGLIPEGLISRVDVVTGGASAAYGSDAVSGVVNFALDTKFNGVKGVAQAGVSERGDAANQKVAITAGADVLGDRGHVLVSGEYYKNEGIFNYNGRDWARKGYAIIAVPGVTDLNKSPTNPRQVVVPNVRTSNGTYGGLITDTALRGTQFLPGGAPSPFTYGSLVSASTMQGGDGIDASRDIGLQPEQERFNLFSRFDYELTDNVSAYVQGIYGQDQVVFISGPGLQAGGSNQFTIFSDNAFLPTSIKDRMATAGVSSFHLGRFSRDTGLATYDNKNSTWQVNGGVKGRFGSGWKFDLFFSHGENRDRSVISNLPIVTNVYNAADAVVNPSNGQIVCRTTLTNPGNGCVPFNVFGDGSPSQAAVNYVTGTAYAVQKATQDNAGFSVTGEPLQLPAGPLSVAFGGEYRHNSASQTADALSTAVVPSNAGIRGLPAAQVGKVGLFDRANPQNFSGSNHVTEGFVEILAPVLHDLPLIHSLDVNGAVRYADYSTSGGVTTWKVGGTYEPFADFRLRATRSRDIRAPSLFELYLAPSPASTGGPITDPFNNNGVSSTINITVAGNRNLKPEVANTLSYGFVYRPHFIRGLGFSVDYWKVDISNAISQLFQTTPATNAQLLVNQCFAGNAVLCDAIHRTGGVITSVDNTYFNISRFTASGVDFELTYKTPGSSMFGLDDTSLAFRGVASYLHELSTQLPGGLVIDRAGDVGQAAAGSPHWTGTVDAELTHGGFSLFAQERFIQGGKIDNTLTASDININHVPSVFYTDLTLRQRVGGTDGTFEMFLTVNNLFDKDPPIDPRFQTFGTIPTNRSLYDVVGRQFTMGARFKF
ncbi:TonB-dependent receptor [Sphingomonas sp. PAMC26645]|uniref:TonB-dependent receptor plug domain-containing protein n=1 Tax=Sphingomonas sp. PAMC26645 TaxID=2565555 RepID=UPI00109DC2AA|nr:TonB-dependent receptor [Sphingomonas sp. PAMC26645]QCB43265.1 TonB-dependent receptor [Sphingomonas sp. PAMC26645]